MFVVGFFFPKYFILLVLVALPIQNCSELWWYYEPSFKPLPFEFFLICHFPHLLQLTLHTAPPAPPSHSLITMPLRKE